MKNIKPKLFFYPAIFVGFGIEVFTFIKIFSLEYVIAIALTIICLHFITLILSLYLNQQNLYIKIPFVSDLIEEPKTPVYRLSEKSWYYDWVIVKSYVGYTFFDTSLLLLFPYIIFFRYKTMVDSEETFEFKYDVLEFKGSLEEEYEKEYQEKHKERLRLEEVQDNKRKVIANLNKDYEENFKK